MNGRLPRVGTVGRGVAVVAACTLPSFLGGVLVDDIRGSFAFGDAAVGMTFAAYWGLAAVAAVPAAGMVRRVGPTRSLRWAGLLTALICIAVVLLARSATSFAAVLVGGGAAVALATPAVNVLIMDAVDHRRRAFAFAVATSSPPLTLVASGTLVPLLTSSLGWRGLYAVAAVLAAAAALSIRPLPAPTALVARAAAPRRHRVTGDGRDVRPLAVVMLGVTAASASLGVMPAFLVSAAPHAGVSGRLAAVTLAVAAGFSIAARLVAGRWTDRSGRDSLPAVVGLLSLGGVGFALMATERPALFVLGAFFVSGPAWVWMALFSYGIVVRYAGAVESASGVLQTGFFTGGVLGPLVFGALTQVGSFRLGWAVLAVAGLVAALSVAAGRRALPTFPRTGAVAEAGSGLE